MPLFKSIVFALRDDLRAGRSQPPAYAPGIEHAANRVGSFLAALIVPVPLAVLCIAVLATLTVSPVLGLPAPLLWGAVVFLLALTLSGFVRQLAGPRRWLAARFAGKLIGPLSR